MHEAAQYYFSKCADEFLRTAAQTINSGDPTYAEKVLNELANNHETLSQEAKKLEIASQNFVPPFLKFTQLQLCLREKAPQIASDLRSRFIRIGLPTYGFEPQKPEPQPSKKSEKPWLLATIGGLAAIIGGLTLLINNVAGLRDAFVHLIFPTPPSIEDGHHSPGPHFTDEVQRRDSLPPMAEDAFDVFNHDRVVDLAGWKEISSDQLDIPTSKVLWHDRFKVKRRNSDIKEFVLRRAVTGTIEPEFSSTTHRVTVKSSQERPLTGPRPIDRLYDVLIDVSNEPINEWFDVQLDSVYWNVFLDKKSQWVGIPVLFDTNSIRFELRSPNRPFTAFEREAYDRNESGGNHLVNDPTADRSQDGKVIIWRIANPHKNWIYKISWEW